MILTVDIGNTRVACGFFEKGEIVGRGFLSDLDSASLKAAFGERVFEGCVFASVVPELSAKFLASFSSLYPTVFVSQLTWEKVAKKVPNSIVVKGMAPGADRVANVYLLHRNGLFPAVSVDAGTALTTEILDAEGRFVGGTIVPGARLQWNSLREKAAQLKTLEFPEKTDGLIGSCSESSMANGIGGILTFGLIELLKKAERELLGESFKSVVFTGGGSKLFHDAAKEVFPNSEFDPDFTLKALCAFYDEEKNEPKA